MENYTKSEKDLTREYIEKYNLEKIASEMLTELVNEKPNNPIEYMIKYISKFLTKEEREELNIKLPNIYQKKKTFSKFPNILNKNSILFKILTKEIFNSIKNSQTKNGNIFNDLIKVSQKNKEDKTGCLLTDADCIGCFDTLIIPLIENVHKINIENQQQKVFEKIKLEISEDYFSKYDDLKNSVKLVRFIFSRNFSNIPFVLSLSKENEKVIGIMSNEINKLMDDQILPFMNKITLKDNKEEFIRILSKLNINKDEINNNINIYISVEESIVFLVNYYDHLKLVLNISTENFNLFKTLELAENILKNIEKDFPFEYSEQLGYINSEINLLGNGLELYSEFEIKNVKKNKLEKLESILAQLFPDYYSIISCNDPKNKTINVKKSQKYYHKSELDLIEEVFSYLNGFILYINNEREYSFKKLNLYIQKQDLFIKNSYDEYFDDYKYTFSFNGTILNDLYAYYVNEQLNPFGILLHDKNQYFIFNNLIKHYVYFSQNYDVIKNKHKNKDEDFQYSSIDEQYISNILFMSICLIRNIDDYPFANSPCNKNGEVELLIKDVINKLNRRKEHFAEYYSLYDSQNKVFTNKLIDDNQLMIFHRDDMKKFDMENDFPKNRGIIYFQKSDIYGMVNDVDHLKFYLNVHNPTKKLNEQIEDFFSIVKDFERKIKFCYDEKLGYLTSCPRFVGNGLLVKIQIKLGNLDKEDIGKILNDKEYAWKITKNAEDRQNIIELLNKYTIGRTEREMIVKLINYINKLYDSGNK